MKTVYLEWFLFDNALMGFLILKGAAAFCRRTLHPWRTALVCAGSAAVAAMAMNAPVLLTFWAKALLLFGMTAAFRFQKKTDVFRCAGGVLLSTCLLGGAAYGLCGLLSGSFSGGVLYGETSVRVVLATAAVGCVLPRRLRALVASRRMERHDVAVQLDTSLGTAVLAGRIDTGNSLREPASGLPVVVVDERSAGLVLPENWAQSWREHPEKGMLLVPYQTVDSAGVMPAMRGRSRLEEGEAQPCCVALSPRRLSGCEAILSGELFCCLPERRKRRTGGKTHEAF